MYLTKYLLPHPFIFYIYISFETTSVEQERQANILEDLDKKIDTFVNRVDLLPNSCYVTILNRISKDGAAFLAPLSAENLITFCLFCVLTNRIIGPKVRPVTAASPQLSHSNSWPHLRAGFGFRL